MSGDVSAFDVLLSVIECTTGVTHEDSSGNSTYCSTYKETTNELYAEEETAYDRNCNSEH